MSLGKMNLLGNQQAQMMYQGNQGFQVPIVPGQFNRTPQLGRGLQRYVPKFGVTSGLFMPPGFAQSMNNFGGGQVEGIPGGMIGRNPPWSTGSQSAGGQGYAAPGYPPQGFQQKQPLQHAMPPSQGYLTQGYPTQRQSYPVYNQGYTGQTPIQPAWEEPKKGGIKAFISNFMAKRKQ
ncbi:hypothetical protein [Desulfosporosinus sp. SB140]|uniref:hypothetical protein n=1 Tax=Desulfosporosinus paludis TaxID=3115649 RepID=UPI00388E4E96